MSKKLLTLLALSASLSLSASANGATHWSYDDAHSSPAHWGELDEKFTACSNGLNQSPINLTAFTQAELPALTFNYHLKSTEILNNGHTVQVNMEAGSTVKVDGIAFELKQFHFHTPSENNINSKSFPLEAHFVHASAKGELAVLAVMLSEGEANEALKGLWKNMPMKAGDKHAQVQDNISTLLPKNKDYYRFNGSLTTPPCTEGVRWLVMKEAVSMSKAQIEAFQKVMKHPNNRPIQATNARAVLQ